MGRSSPGRSALTRRELLAALGAGVAGLSLGGERPPRRRRPNLLLIVADDFGYECVGANGGTSYRTPNLDRLATSGALFRNAFANPVCVPSRVQLLSGQYPFRSGWTDQDPSRDALDPTLAVLPRMLRAAGYRTAVAGKWQLARFDERPDHAWACGFDEHCLWTWRRKGTRTSRYWKPDIWKNGRSAPEHAQTTIFGPDVFADFLLDFIARAAGKPFFAYYPMTLPHRPFVETPASQESARNDTVHFRGMVEYLDEIVGRLIRGLTEAGSLEKTLILFTSDNGTNRRIVSRFKGIDVRGGKDRLSEAGTHVPMIASWPGTLPAGTAHDALVDLSDLVPTIAEATRATPPAGHRLDGRSFLGHILGGTRGPEREWIFVQKGSLRAIRTDRWRLDSRGRLFDLGADPWAESLANKGDPDAATARDHLSSILEALGGAA